MVMPMPVLVVTMVMAMNGARVRAPVIFMEMRKVMAMTMAVPAVRPQIAPRGDRKPATKRDECEARDRVDDVAKAFCESDPRQPEDYRDEQCRKDVPAPGQKRGPRRFRFRPAPLPCNQRDWHPVIWDDGVQHTDRADSGYQ